MNPHSTYQRLIDYHSWQQSQVLAVLTEAGDSRASQKGAMSFGSLKSLVEHLAWSEEMWYRRIEPSVEVILKENASLSELKTAWEKITLRWKSYILKSQERDWAQNVSYVNTQNQSFENTIDEIFTHMIDHSTYHAGQFMSGARAIGIEPRPCTLIFFLREKHKATIN